MQTTERSLSSYHDGEPVMLTHTITREQWARGGKRRHYTGPRMPRTARRTRPVRDIMAAAPAVPATTSSAAEWRTIMADARSALGVGE